MAKDTHNTVAEFYLCLSFLKRMWCHGCPFGGCSWTRHSYLSVSHTGVPHSSRYRVTLSCDSLSLLPRVIVSPVFYVCPQKGNSVPGAGGSEGQCPDVLSEGLCLGEVQLLLFLPGPRRSQ